MGYRRGTSQTYLMKRRSPPKRSPYPYANPRQIDPMKAETGSEKNLKDKDKDAQRKWDGTRTLPIKCGDKIVLRGRSWINDYAPRHDEIVQDMRKVKARNTVMDGELTFFKGKDRDVFLTVSLDPKQRKATRPR